MDILHFINRVKLRNSTIINIGYKLFNDQFAITVDLFDWSFLDCGEVEPGRVFGNFIFLGVTDVAIESKYFVLKNNKILDIAYDRINDNLYKITLIFFASDDTEVVTLSFKTIGVEWEPIYPYLYDS